MFAGWRRSDRSARSRYALLLVAFAVTLAAQLLTLLPTALKLPFINPASVTGEVLNGLVAPALFAYAILRHRVFDLGFALNRTLVYGLVSAILLAAFGLIEWAVDHLVPIAGREKNAIVDAAIAVGVFLTFHRVRDGVERVVERLFFRSWQRAEANLRRFVREAAFVTRAPALAQAFARALGDYAEGAEAAVYLAKGDGYARTEGKVSGVAQRLDANLPALVSLRANPKPVELPDTELGAALIAPMINRNEVIGVVLLGPKPCGLDYRPDEIELIGWAALQVGLDLYALRVEQLEKDLQAANAQIDGMLRLKAQRA
jgi:hypothetical protein